MTSGVKKYPHNRTLPYITPDTMLRQSPYLVISFAVVCRYSIETSGASPCTASGHCQFVKMVVRLQVASRRTIARSVRQAQSPRKRLRLTSSINRRPNFQSMSQYVIIRSCLSYFSSIRPHKKAVSAKMARRTKNCLEGEAADLIKSQSPISHRPQPHSDPLTALSLQFRSVPFPAEFGQCPLIIIISVATRFLPSASPTTTEKKKSQMT